MKRSQNDTLHRVRAVQSWLEKAEASFDKESDIKGELNLMLAEAEMKNLRRHHPVHKRFLRFGAIVAALCLVTGGWYLFHQPRQIDLPRPVEASVYGERPKHESGDTAKQAAAPAAAPQEAVGNPGADENLQLSVQTLPQASSDTASAVDEELAVQPAAPAAGDQEAASPAVREEKAVLSDSQLQATVQEARHTLRGTGMAK